MNRPSVRVTQAGHVTRPLLLAAATLFLGLSGCRDAPSAPPAAKTTPTPPPAPRPQPEVAPQQPDRSTPERVTARPRAEEAAGKNSDRSSDKPVEQGTSDEQGGTEPGKSVAAGGRDNGGSEDGIDSVRGAPGRTAFDGTRAPKTPEESISIASGELKSSGSAEADGDLPAAVRHAARALQAAGAFPKNPKCAALADAARGRLKKLEGKGVTPGNLSRSGPLDTRRIIESP